MKGSYPVSRRNGSHRWVSHIRSSYAKKNRSTVSTVFIGSWRKEHSTCNCSFRMLPVLIRGSSIVLPWSWWYIRTAIMEGFWLRLSYQGSLGYSGWEAFLPWCMVNFQWTISVLRNYLWSRSKTEEGTWRVWIPCTYRNYQVCRPTSPHQGTKVSRWLHSNPIFWNSPCAL